MSVKIKFKTGVGVPNKLDVGEPAFDKQDNITYIGDKDGNPVPLSGGKNNISTVDEILNDGSLVIGRGKKEVTTLKNGNNGQILKILDGKPSYVDDISYDIQSSDDSIDISEVEEDFTKLYELSISSVSTDKITQGNLLLILNGGSSES